MHGTSAIALALLSTVVLGCGDASPSALAGPAVQQTKPELDAGARRERPGSVTGSGHWTINGELRTFAFHAIANDDGTAKGTFELHNRALDARLHGRVTCLTTFANQAWFGGVIENSTGAVGEAIWRVKDNGEGEDAAPDQISLLFSTPTEGTAARYCLIRPLTPLNTIESGNVQVHPTADLSEPFTGVWSGLRFTPDGRPCCAFRWDIQQTGNAISGLLFAPHTGCANIGGCPVSGIVTGNMVEFEVELSFLPGAIDRGTAILDGNIITGTVANCRFDSCAPAVPFRVTRQ